METKETSELITIRHGRLRMEIPAGWADRSSLVFVSPPKDEPTVPLAAKKAGQYYNNVNINFEPKPDDVNTTTDYLASVNKSLREAGMEFQDIETTPLTMGGNPGHCVERRLKLGDVWVRQITAVAFFGELMVIATASTAESMHKTEIAQLRKLVETVRFE